MGENNGRSDDPELDKWVESVFSLDDGIGMLGDENVARAAPELGRDPDRDSELGPAFELEVFVVVADDLVPGTRTAGVPTSEPEPKCNGRGCGGGRMGVSYIVGPKVSITLMGTTMSQHVGPTRGHNDRHVRLDNGRDTIGSDTSEPPLVPPTKVCTTGGKPVEGTKPDGSEASTSASSR